MGMTEKEIYEAFGFEEEGAKAAELADPQDSDLAEGEKGQETADPADDDTAETVNDEDEGTDADADGADEDDEADRKGEGSAQSPEERAKHAAARRKAETDAAVKRAVNDAEQSAAADFEELLRISALKDPLTGKRITTRAEFEASRANFTEKNRSDVMKRTGMSKEELDALVSDLPEVKAAKVAQAKAAEEGAKAELMRQVGEITKFDPSITSLSELVRDLESDGSYSEFYEKVNKGYTLPDAYKLVRGDAISKKTTEAVRAAERQRAAGKAHMQRTAQRGSGAAAVPGKVKSYYKSLFPDMSDADIAKHYQKNLKQEE